MTLIHVERCTCCRGCWRGRRALTPSSPPSTSLSLNVKVSISSPLSATTVCFLSFFSPFFSPFFSLSFLSSSVSIFFSPLVLALTSCDPVEVFLRLSKTGDARNFREDDVFVDVYPFPLPSLLSLPSLLFFYAIL